MTPPKTQNNVPIVDDWTEYKRLVLSELERLNLAVDKLNDKCAEIQTHILAELNSLRESLNEKLNSLDKDHPTILDCRGTVLAFKQEVDGLEKKFLLYIKEQQKDSTITSKWGLWAAVITIVGSLIVSIISLIITMVNSVHHHSP